MKTATIIIECSIDSSYAEELSEIVKEQPDRFISSDVCSNIEDIIDTDIYFEEE